MALKINTAPTAEPISLAEAKTHLRLDSASPADHLTSQQSIAPGAHVIAAAYSLVGTAIEVLGYNVLVSLVAGTNGAGGTVDVKLQDSDDNVTFTDVSSGAFTQVTEANDNTTYEKAYTGGRRYLRVVCTVGTATCSFGVDIILIGVTSVEDTYIESLITAARRQCENILWRALINQTWELWLDKFPDKDYLEIPLPPLSSISSIKYYDTANTEYTVTATDYFVDSKSEPGRVCLAYGKDWPTTTLRDYNGFCITFVAGYGASSSYVPQDIRNAMLLIISHLYEHREAVTEKSLAVLPLAVESLLFPYRVWGF